ncbi:MAG: aldo/keto reductase [Actinomycetota bacterium]|nr:aldo/keto reductase [Actinomycetota bacterium]
MEKRSIERANISVSSIGLGTWQLGADWGEVSDAQAIEILESSYEAGINFFDTADVYGDGRSEQLIGGFLKNVNDDSIIIATKMGRRAPLDSSHYTYDNFASWIDRSQKNLGVDKIDLIQLHCPPDDVFDIDEVYDSLDRLVDSGAIGHYGVSVETCSQALRAMERPNVATIQIIFNAFRLKPLDEVLPRAKHLGVGVIARVPLASGLLSGKYKLDTVFAKDDHRNYNRNGEAFDMGETFSGVDYEVGIEAAAKFAGLQDEVPPATAALAWILSHDAVSTVIPGARNLEQLKGNLSALEYLEVGASIDSGVVDIYNRYLREAIHPRW